MVVNHVHDNADSRVMERLNHLLAFLDADIAVIWVG